MLNVNQLIGFGAGAPAAAPPPAGFNITHGGTYTSTTNSNSYTFNSVNFGPTEGRTGILVVAFAYGTTALISSITVGGTATTSVSTTRNITSTPDLTVCSRQLSTSPSGTSGTVVVTWSATTNGCVLGIYSIYNSNALFITGLVQITSSATTSVTSSLTASTAYDYALVPYAINNGPSFGVTFGGTLASTNEQYDSAAESSVRVAYGDTNVFQGVGAARTITFTSSSSYHWIYGYIYARSTR